jgi:uncharacterized protein
MRAGLSFLPKIARILMVRTTVVVRIALRSCFVPVSLNSVKRMLPALIGVFIHCLFPTSPLAQVEPSCPASGIWVGKLSIPHGPTLRVGIAISGNACDSLKATLRIVEQNTGDITCDRAWYEDGRILLGIKPLSLEIEGKADLVAGVMTVEFHQRGGRFPLVLTKSAVMPVLHRPQEPKRPFPYHEEQVEYPNQNAGIKLAGTLTYPDSGGPFTAVVLLTGSGPQNRDEEFLGHKPFLVLADYLTRQGIAVLRADDRGVGGSGGDFQKSSSADFADDALAGAAYLKNRKEIDARKIGLIGHSEGGMSGPIAASRSAEVAFIVMMAGPGIGLDEAVIHQIADELRSQGASEEDIALQRSWRRSLYGLFKQNLDEAGIEAGMRKLYAALSEDDKKRLNWPEGRLQFEIQRSLSPWWLFALAYDPAATLRQVRCPVLAINGEKDRQNVSSDNIRAIEKALSESGNKDFLVKELPGLNHFFQTSETGSKTEYGIIEETISPDAMQLIARWIQEVSAKSSRP